MAKTKTQLRAAKVKNLSRTTSFPSPIALARMNKSGAKEAKVTAKPAMKNELVKFWISVAFAMALTTANAQTPYAGMQSRPIKGLSEQQVTDLRAGRGMGLALAAELNGYPGPSHVLELADKLELSLDQRTRIKGLFDSMKAEALPVGSKLIEQEADLDKQFASHAVTPASLKALTAAAATTQGELRETHLKYHLSTLALLSPLQMERYAELRGYDHEKPLEHRH